MTESKNAFQCGVSNWEKLVVEVMTARAKRSAELSFGVWRKRLIDDCAVAEANAEQMGDILDLGGMPEDLADSEESSDDN